MDIIILLLMLLTGGLMLFDASHRVTLACWIVTALLIAGLFNYHVSSSLNLSF